MIVIVKLGRDSGLIGSRHHPRVTAPPSTDTVDIVLSKTVTQSTCCGASLSTDMMLLFIIIEILYCVFRVLIKSTCFSLLLLL